MTTPNFLFIGPDKTGSTWVHRILDLHPDCFVPAAKDLYFFDRYHRFGMKWYELHFAGVDGEAVVAEVCHDYLLSDEALERIQATLGDVRLMVTIRDPVERAWSQYQHALSIGRRFDGFADALAQWPALIHNSRYGERLNSVYSRFDRSRVLVTDFCDLTDDAVAYARSIFDFLGVDPGRVSPEHVSDRVLGQRIARSAGVARAGKAIALGLRKVGMPGLLGRIKLNRHVQRVFFRRVAGANAGERLGDAERQTIVTALADDIDVLDRLRGVDHRRRWGWTASSVEGTPDRENPLRGTGR